jgi:hypothetical protein
MLVLEVLFWAVNGVMVAGAVWSLCNALGP